MHQRPKTRALGLWSVLANASLHRQYPIYRLTYHTFLPCLLQNQLESDLVTVQDYLACMFRNLITQSTLALENYMDNAKLTLFEQAVAGVQLQVK